MPTIVHTIRRGWVYSPFTCEYCGHEDQGAIHMKVGASAQVGILQDYDDTRDLAMGTAHGNMEQAGDELIALSPCPACGKRDELAVKSFYAKAKPWIGSGALFLVVGLAGAGYLASEGEPEMGLLATSPLLLIGLVVLIAGLGKRLRKLPPSAVFRSRNPEPWAHLGPERASQ
ncbi:hypothetical protein ENSA5_11450 [Enhygromyxa salina]|uniref:Uncharacterized protein n=1 Tax=Enhygromyxa salina TaxID=215803 RepID=A0A2S9YG64_9BACT|nr:hypothetical protein [Enhygromyxa salina]PRQ04097.1 hypothetical protein ENSA5_11450 [Enhygromyxa salina]